MRSILDNVPIADGKLIGPDTSATTSSSCTTPRCLAAHDLLPKSAPANTTAYRLLIGIFTIVDKIPPFHQKFALENYTLHYPYAVKERVPVIWLCVYVIAAPAVIIGFYTMVIDGLFSHQTAMPTTRTGIKRLSGRYRFKDRLWELNCGILGLGLSVGAAFTITGALKNAIGKPRPDLIDRQVLQRNQEVMVF